MYICLYVCIFVCMHVCINDIRVVQKIVQISKTIRKQTSNKQVENTSRSTSTRHFQFLAEVKYRSRPIWTKN